MERKIADCRRRVPTLLVVAVACAGCSRKEQGLVLTTPSVTAPPILRSEAEQIAIPVRIDAPIRFENRSRVEQVLSVSKTGCSCYGMSTVEGLLTPGGLVTVAPGASRDLFFVAKELQGEAEQAFRVGFRTGPTSQASSSSSGEELRVDCSMKVFPDLVLEPGSILIDLPANRDGASRTDSSRLTITRVTRGQPSDSAPVFAMTPPLLAATPARLDPDVEEISPGLWRSVWRMSVTLEQIPAEIRDSGGRFSFAFEFPEENLPPIETRPPPRDGRIPTILDVVGNHPPRNVSGQLILRRSNGIIAPAQLHFGSIPLGSAPRTRRLVLTAADHRPFQLTISELPPQFTASEDSREPSEQQWISVTFQPGAAGDHEGRMTASTTHPDQPEVEVMLKARVQ
jgi:hypothetical protein